MLSRCDLPTERVEASPYLEMRGFQGLLKRRRRVQAMLWGQYLGHEAAASIMPGAARVYGIACFRSDLTNPYEVVNMREGEEEVCHSAGTQWRLNLQAQSRSLLLQLRSPTARMPQRSNLRSTPGS